MEIPWLSKIRVEMEAKNLDISLSIVYNDLILKSK